MPRASAKKITVDYVCEDLGISRSTFYDWRTKGRAPKCIKLFNGSLRVHRSAYHKWLAALEETPTARARYDEEKLSVNAICEDLDISRSTFYDWRTKERAPRCLKLPNSELRIYRSDYEHWLASLEDAA